MGRQSTAHRNSEVVVWILVSIAASLGASSSLQAGVESALTALGVVLFVLTLGRRVTFWALRGVADRVPLARLAAARRAERAIFDVTGLAVGRTGDPLPLDEAGVLRALGTIAAVPEVQLTQRQVVAPDAPGVLCAAAGDHDLVIMGARPPQGPARLSFGALQDRLLRDARADILLVVSVGEGLAPAAPDAARRILVPVNGLAHALAAGDVAAVLARGDDVDVVLLHVGQRATTGEADEPDGGLVRDLAARLALLGIRVDHRVRVGDHPGRAILRELERERYAAVVVGGRHRGGTRLTLGDTFPTVLTQRHTPTLVLIASR